MNEEFFEINKDTLDEEWVNQPALYNKYAAKLANARQELEEAKADLELTEAELDRQIRSEPGKYGIEKVSESAIKSAIICQTSYQKGNTILIEAKHTVDVLSGAVTTLDHKKKALEKLVDLRLADYFSSPRASERSKENMNHVKQEAALGGKKRKVRDAP